MPFWNLIVIFFKIGLFSFGGGYAMLPLIFQSIQEFAIMTSAEFSRLVALSQVTPGPIAVNAATYVGFKYAGFPGALVATIGVVLPSFILILITIRFMEKFQESKSLDSVLSGIRPATVGLIASAVIFLAENSLVKGPLLSPDFIWYGVDYINLLPCIVFIGTILLTVRFKMGPIKLTILAGILGALFIR